MNFKHSKNSGFLSSLPKHIDGGTQRHDVSSLNKLQILADKSPNNLQMMALKDQIQRKPSADKLKSDSSSNGKGLPAQLQSGVEQLSGVNMSDVKVNYGSSEPSKIGAAAYAQGSNIHLGPGQEQHLPHEAWHVVQQKKGKVTTTNSINGTPVNESPTLENEADQMGIKAQGLGKQTSKVLQRVRQNPADRSIIQKKVDPHLPGAVPLETPAAPIQTPAPPQAVVQTPAASAASPTPAQTPASAQTTVADPTAIQTTPVAQTSAASTAAASTPAQVSASAQSTVADPTATQVTPVAQTPAPPQATAQIPADAPTASATPAQAPASTQTTAAGPTPAPPQATAQIPAASTASPIPASGTPQTAASTQAPPAPQPVVAGQIPNIASVDVVEKNKGIIDMAINAKGISNNSSLWARISDEGDMMETASPFVGLANDITQGVTEKSNADLIAEGISASVGSSILSLFQTIKTIKTIKQASKDKDKKGVITGATELITAIKSGLEAANNIIKVTAGAVNPAIAQAIPGLGIVISAAEIMINLHNTWNAKNAEDEMSIVSGEYKKQLSTELGGSPEDTAAKLFDIESRGKVFHKKMYLRLRPGIMAGLAEIAADPDQESKFEVYKTGNGLPSTLNFENFYLAVRTYELGSKLQEINQKRKVHGGNEIFISLLNIAGDIATFFPADGAITAAVLKGSAGAIKGGLAAGKFIQSKSRNRGFLGANTDRSSAAKHQEYIQHVQSIYLILDQANMEGQDKTLIETSKIDQIVPVESMISASGVSLSSVYATDYSNQESVFAQIKLIVDSMKKGR